ncbi:glyoxalase [Bordetella genomosp. 1]|uniref:Glyoxalase n=1 Tax=Bordetella genomosp. 1 TaxID=1395607 RepID=A0A261SG07_9BORD|nr:VOC family protein [Bordetella genomosp. 1]MDQ8034339.1 VOC family protein [Bordetella sp.]OZI35937.1 glyoxalase [Bordetella genomosp. 1]OZI58605.1 glyoxalase [Bordetella genomosp. 1]
MRIKRIVANLAARDPAQADHFYRETLGLEVLMDHGWITTYGADEEAEVQLSIASQGGNDTPVPDLSIEVDDLDEALARVQAGGYAVEYGPALEPWGVRRFFVRDPLGKLVNLLQHVD